MSDESPSASPRTEAKVRRSSWPGWIWAIPIAAVLLIGWWAARSLLRGGEDITITFDDVHGLRQSDATVEFRGMTVGKVDGAELAKDGKSVSVSVHIEERASQFLTTGTRFWLKGVTPSLSDAASLTAVVSGPTLVMEPGPGPKATHYVGLTRRPVARDVGQAQTYGVALAGAVGSLQPGDLVKLRGFTLGEVKSVGVRYDEQTGEIETPVALTLYPSLLHLANGPELTAALDRLIRQGLQARLEREPPLVGSAQVELEMVRGASGAAASVADGVPQIPAASGGGIDTIVDRIDKLPIQAIAQNVLDATHRLDDVASSPQLQDVIAQLDGTLRQVHQTVATASPQLVDLVARLRQMSEQLDAAIKAVESTAKATEDTAKSADKTLAGAANQNGVPAAIREITEAARSVRDLANYLDRHPEALIKGKAGQ